MRRRLAAAALAAALAAAMPARPQEVGGTAGPALTSAPYDPSLFRDGETRRMRARYGRWTAVCDEIIRLRSRYCSLSAPVGDAGGATVARLDVSTDDAGRPAALLHLPLGALFDRPVTLSRMAWVDPRHPASPSCGAEQGFVGMPTKPCLGQARPGHGIGPRALRATRCDAADCAAVWSLDAADFDALKRDGFALTYRRTARLDVPGAWLRPADVETVTGLVPSDGFAEAVAATMRPGPLAEAAPAEGDLGLRR